MPVLKIRCNDLKSAAQIPLSHVFSDSESGVFYLRVSNGAVRLDACCTHYHLSNFGSATRYTDNGPLTVEKE